MIDINYILRKGRFKIVFWDLFIFGIIILGVIVFSLVITIYSKPLYQREIVILTSFFIVLVLCFLFFKNLIVRVSFDSYINKSTKDNNDIILEIKDEFSLKLFDQNKNTFSFFYYLPTKIWRFKIRKNIHIIFDENLIMINIRNSDNSIVFNLIKDQLALKIKKSLEIKTNNISSIF